MSSFSIGENIAAISATLHAPHMKDKYGALYENQCDRIGGFTGIWGWCVTSGEKWEDIATDLKMRAGIEYDWIKAIDLFVKYTYDRVLDDMEDLDNDRRVRFDIVRAINESREDGSYSVKIKWGDRDDEVGTYRFHTKPERDAFMSGVDEGNGWLSYEDVS